MTGRDIAAAVKPLESGAKAILRLSALAHEAIRLEEGQAQADKALAATRAALAEAVSEVAILRAEAKNLTATLAAERAASETETVERCAGIVAEADGLAAKAKVETDAWTERGRKAATAHAETIAAYRMEISALQEHLDGLREQARALAQRAGAVVR